MPDPEPAPAPARPATLPTVLAAVGFALALAAPFLPWWTMTVAPPGTVWAFSLGGACYGTLCTDYPAATPLADVFGTAQLLARAGALLGALALGLLLAGRLRPGLRRGFAPAAGAAAVLVLAAPLVLATGLPGALGDSSVGDLHVASFFGTWVDGSGIVFTYGAGAGWYLALAAAVVFVVAALLALLAALRARRAPPTF